MSCSRVMGMLFACVSVSLALVSLVSDFWMVNSNSNSHLGLWHGCTQGRCFDVVAGTEYIDVSRAFMILATVAGFISVFASGVSFASHASAKRIGSIGALVTSCLAVLFLTIGVAVYTGKTIGATNHEHSMLMYGWSFYLGWVAFPFLCITAVLHFLAYRSTPTSGYEQV